MGTGMNSVFLGLQPVLTNPLLIYIFGEIQPIDKQNNVPK